MILLSKKIPNPFKEEWESFDLDAFKEDICQIIDEIIECKNEETVSDLLIELDDEFLFLTTLVQYKDQETLEVIRLVDIPEEALLDMGLSKDEIMSFDEKDTVPIDHIGSFIDLSFIDIINKDSWKI